MSWLAKLYETYEAVAKNDKLNESLEPYFHKYEQCHIEIILDDDGNFIRAESLVHEVSYGKQTYWKGEETLIPITPKSLTGRTSGPAPYPLAEQIQYVAKDYQDFGGEKESYFKEYHTLLDSWVSSKFTHPKVEAVKKYIEKGAVVRDLLDAGILYSYLNNGSKLLITNWAKQGPCDEDSNKKVAKPPLLNAVNGGEQGNAKIRWRVQRPGEPDDLTWGDPALIEKWKAFSEEENQENDICQLLGKKSFIANSHPKGIIKKINDAKLISVPTDSTYLTFRGRFTDSNQACALSFEVSQKAHNVLRWLIARQGYQNGEQVIVAWAVSGQPIPELMEDIWTVLHQAIGLPSEIKQDDESVIDHSIDAGQSFALQLNNYMRGYSEKLKPSESIVVLGLDAATKGRLGVTYYRELMASEFFERLEKWHTQFAWPQRHTIELPNSKEGKKPISKTIWPVSSPVPRSIADAAYGDILKSNDTLRKSLHERILPCIVDGRPFPQDIMLSAVRKACNRTAKRLPDKFSNYKSERAEWEKHLGVACALYRGFHQRHTDRNQRRTYAMTLEKDNRSRDYLYGRLLAIAERIEEIALSVGGENRPTTAARMMQRFADRPSSTWRNIELAIQPFMQRLQSSRPGFLANRKKELDDVTSAFQNGDFSKDKPLSGEFLLGYHCQRMVYRNTQSETIQED
ncbi:MAG: type I-C CRISPR-associated protein Cas8c/Csd1 [Desulfobulbaceae bacterium]|nr:type I-C CRISPR-associated protein Cas8c/Csd1 [Desulfobulbaceae bacterium]